MSTGNEHGWLEVPPYEVGITIVKAARRAADHAAHDLGLDLVSLRFFRSAPNVQWDPTGPDPAIVILNAPPIDPAMLGKACHPEAVSPLTVWVRSTLSAPAATAIVYHESRHLWQGRLPETAAWSHEQCETDADQYMTQAIRRHEGFTPETLRAVLLELGMGG